ncbi:hypothetical protein [Streptomyces hirsutus]|nr:hypothetical protein [Streptomyces hirsutus]
MDTGRRPIDRRTGDSEPSTAENSGHCLHVDEPEVAVEAIGSIAAQAAG